jgi:hypothetical protein
MALPYAINGRFSGFEKDGLGIVFQKNLKYINFPKKLRLLPENLRKIRNLSF